VTEASSLSTNSLAAHRDAAPTPPDLATSDERYRWRDGTLAQILRRPLATAAFGYLLLLVVLALGAKWIAPDDPAQQSLLEKYAGPSAQHWLGTDEFGRDVLSRLIYGSRVSLEAPVLAVGIALILGVPLGMWAATRRGTVDVVAGRIVDTLLSLPGMVVALAVIAVLGPGLVNVMVAIGVLSSTSLFRVARAATLSVREETFMDSAKAIGCSGRRMMWVHTLPNIAPPLLVQSALMMGFAIIIEASLSFLGLGVQPPTSSWGSMLQSTYQNQYDAQLTAIIAPGVALCLTVLALSVIGDTIRDVMVGDRGER
jgi:peptide/nickel transport system permease protein